jgi:hypothetical protein
VNPIWTSTTLRCGTLIDGYGIRQDRPRKATAQPCDAPIPRLTSPSPTVHSVRIHYAGVGVAVAAGFWLKLDTVSIPLLVQRESWIIHTTRSLAFHPFLPCSDPTRKESRHGPSFSSSLSDACRQRTRLQRGASHICSLKSAILQNQVPWSRILATYVLSQMIKSPGSFQGTLSVYLSCVACAISFSISSFDFSGDTSTTWSMCAAMYKFIRPEGSCF